MRQRATIPTLLLLLALVVSACSSALTTTTTSTSVAQASPPAASDAAPTVANTPTVASTPTVATTPTRESTPTTETTPTTEATELPEVTETATVSETQVLEAKFYQDSDGNSVPDFLEVELGYDPNADDCGQRACGEGAEGTEMAFKTRNTLLMLDSSGSMAGQVLGGNKLDAAKQALLNYVGFATTVSNVGFLVYGHKGNNTEAGKPESCVGIDLLTPVGQVDSQTFPGVLDQFQPTGWTPIAAALTKAGEAFIGKEDDINRIIMVSDGIETCEGNPVAVAEQLHNNGLAIKIDVIGFDIQEGSADQAQLREIARVTNGEYYDAKTSQELRDYFREQGDRLTKTFESFLCEVQNSTGATQCDLLVTTRAVSRLRDRMFAAEPYSPESEAYQDLIDKIEAGVNERQKARDEASKRVTEIAAQYQKLLEQLSRTQQGQNTP